MSHPTLFFYPRPRVDIAEVPALSHAGAVLLTDTIHATGLAPSLREALAPWTKPLAEHHAAKVLLDLALTLAIGGEHASDTDLLRCEPGLFGDVASTPTISRTLTTLAQDAPTVIEAISKARRAARERAWTLAGAHSPAAGVSAKSPLVVDLDATLITAHSEKEQAAPTFKRGFGYHPLCAFLDHGSDGTGEPLAIQLRPGNAGSNTAADHITVTRQALAQLPAGLLARGGRGVVAGAGWVVDHTVQRVADADHQHAVGPQHLRAGGAVAGQLGRQCKRGVAVEGVEHRIARGRGRAVRPLQPDAPGVAAGGVLHVQRVRAGQLRRWCVQQAGCCHVGGRRSAASQGRTGPRQQHHAAGQRCRHGITSRSSTPR